MDALTGKFSFSAFFENVKPEIFINNNLFSRYDYQPNCKHI